MSDNIVHVHVHQAVKFNGSLATFFTIKPSPGKVRANFKLRPEIFCLEIFSEKDRVLVPFVNVASMHLDSKIEEERDSKKEKEAAASKKVTKNVIKRPR